jgi:hypothetical protein
MHFDHPRYRLNRSKLPSSCLGTLSALDSFLNQPKSWQTGSRISILERMFEATHEVLGLKIE